MKGRYISRAKIFIKENILNTPEMETSGTFVSLIRNVINAVRVTVKHFLDDELQLRASALTYSTLLAIVPILALLFAIAGGFGFQNIIQSQLFTYFPAQKDILTEAISFVNTYLAQSRSSVFLGFGIVLLLWSVLSLMMSVETTMNRIWQAKQRSIFRKITDYTSLFLILPILIILSAGTSIFITTFVSETNLPFITPILYKLIEFTPYIITIILYTLAYILLPNVKVKFKYAFISAIICGTAFQLFQYMYINGQIWVAKYNAIYGSIAFLPLLLLWLQISWLFFLSGALITFSLQNYDSDNEDKIRHISRRYRDFVTLLIVTEIVKRFKDGETPFTARELSNTLNIPIRLVTKIIKVLIKAGVVSETPSSEDRVPAFQPAIDISTLTVGALFDRVDTVGVGESVFRIDREDKFSKLQDIVSSMRNSEDSGRYTTILIKEIEV